MRNAQQLGSRHVCWDAEIDDKFGTKFIATINNIQEGPVNTNLATMLQGSVLDMALSFQSSINPPAVLQ